MSDENEADAAYWQGRKVGLIVGAAQATADAEEERLALVARAERAEGNATQRQAELVMQYVEGWLSNDYPEAARYIREHYAEMSEQMVEDDCAELNEEQA